VGLDYLNGGPGADRLVLAVGNSSKPQSGGEASRVIGFNPNEGDRFALSGLSFGQLSFNSNQILSGSTFFPHLPVQALTWTVNNGTMAGTNPVIGNFTIDNESS
jgi:hypothetical protein